MAIDEHGIVRDALTLSGWTTFSRGKRLDGLVGLRTNRIVDTVPLPGLKKQQQEAARQAVDFARSRVAAV
jgi:hypothetical protein